MQHGGFAALPPQQSHHAANPGALRDRIVTCPGQRAAARLPSSPQRTGEEGDVRGVRRRIVVGVALLGVFGAVVALVDGRSGDGSGTTSSAGSPMIAPAPE